MDAAYLKVKVHEVYQKVNHLLQGTRKYLRKWLCFSFEFYSIFFENVLFTI